MSNSELAQRFVRLEAGSRMRLVACKLAAGSWQDVGNTAMGYLSDAGTAVRQGLDAAGGAAMDYLESPTLGEVQQGAADGKLLFDQEQAGVLPTVSLNPRPPMDWSERTSKLLNNPSAVGRMALIGGGIAAGSLATSVMRRMAERRRRRVAMRELERMGIKLSEFDWKQWAGQGAQEAGRVAKQVGSQGVEAVKQWSAVPENQRNAKLVGGGAVVGAVLTTLVKRRAEKRRARALGQALNIKRADGEWWRQYTDPLAAGATKMMSNYQLGSQLGGIKDRAAGGIEHLKNLIRRGLSDPKQRAYVTAALGAAAGGGVAGMTELMSGRRKKRYLNAVLSGATGGALAGGALGYMTNPSAQQTDAPASGATLSAQSPSAALDPSAEAERILALPPADREAAVQQLSDTERELTPSLAESYPGTTGALAGAGTGLMVGEAVDRRAHLSHGNLLKSNIASAATAASLDPNDVKAAERLLGLQEKLFNHRDAAIKRPLGKLTGRGLIGAAVGLGLSQVPKLFGSAPQPADPATLYSAQLNNN